MGTPCGAQGRNLLFAKVDGSKNVLLHAGRLARPLLPVIRETTESPAALLAWFRVPFPPALIGVSRALRCNPLWIHQVFP